MKKYLVLGALLLSLVAIPVFAQTTITAEQIIQALTANPTLLAQLRVMLFGGGNNNNINLTCGGYSFERNLYHGTGGGGLEYLEPDVRNLQDVLEKEGFIIDRSEKLAGSVFQESTAAAVVRFQQKYGIVATGYVGQLTRAKLNALYGPNGSKCVQPVNPQAPVINGVSGPATLSVGQTGTWEIKASSNHANEALSYTVLWGDEGTTYGRPATENGVATSGQLATFTHSYSQAGYYTVVFTVYNSQGQSTTSKISVRVGNVDVPAITQAQSIGGTGNEIYPKNPVYVTGTNLPSSGTVYVGTKTASITSSTGTSLKFTAPSTLTAGNYDLYILASDGTTKSNTVSVKVTTEEDDNDDDDSSTTATFVVNTTSGTGGKITMWPTTPRKQGEKVTLTATPNSGYKFVTWTGDLAGWTANPIGLQFLEARNYNVGATFEKVESTTPPTPSTTPAITQAQSLGGTGNEIYPKNPVYVTGTNLPSSGTVYVGTKTASITSSTGTSLKFTAPSTLTAGNYDLYILASDGTTKSNTISVKVTTEDTYVPPATTPVPATVSALTNVWLQFDSCTGGSRTSTYLNAANRTIDQCISRSNLSSGSQVVSNAWLQYDTCGSGTQTSWFADSGTGRTIYQCIQKSALSAGSQYLTNVYLNSGSCRSGDTKSSWFTDPVTNTTVYQCVTIANYSSVSQTLSNSQMANLLQGLSRLLGH